MRPRFEPALLLGLALLGGCAHLHSEDRYRSRVAVVALKGCQALAALKSFELGLFQRGFVRESGPAEPVPDALAQGLARDQARLIAYSKSDFEEARGAAGSDPYRETVNTYKVVGCEERAGGLYLFVVRHDWSGELKFLGSRFRDALSDTGCVVEEVASPRDLGFYGSATEEDLLLHARRGRCRDYAAGK